jgi:ribonuclease HI
MLPVEAPRRGTKIVSATKSFCEQHIERMSVAKPHFLLFSNANGRNHQGEWRFVLKAADGAAVLEAEDCEPEMHGERLELLAVVRGLEALDQPSSVTLVTPSTYVSRGVTYGLEEWRRSGWTWESYGQMVPVKNRDLWQRLDRALTFHRVEFRGWRFDAPHLPPSQPTVDRTQPMPATDIAHARPRRRRLSWRLVRAACQRRGREWVERWKLSLGRLGTSLLPSPWLG